MKKSIKRSLIIVGISLFMGVIPFFTLYSQPPGMPSNPTQAPIDGGLSILALSGAVYAYKKMKSNK